MSSVIAFDLNSNSNYFKSFLNKCKHYFIWYFDCFFTFIFELKNDDNCSNKKLYRDVSSKVDDSWTAMCHIFMKYWYIGYIKLRNHFVKINFVLGLPRMWLYWTFSKCRNFSVSEHAPMGTMVSESVYRVSLKNGTI